ncbi:MAG: hypothetical protein CL867_02580 [Cytophagaceae bacterium]|nr:hypothetical protein [Cytophagaceae bacterium]
MPNTQGFEIVSEVTVNVLREILHAAWKSGDDLSGEGVIPEKLEIPPGTALGPYQLKEGTVQIPKETLGLDMETSINGVNIKLGTIVHVEVDNPPIPSAKFFDLTSDIEVKVPITTLEGGVNVGAKLDGLTSSDVSATITSGDPIGPITAAMVEEYVHEKLRNDDSFPKIYPDIPINFPPFSMDARLELYDDASDAAKTAKVTYPNPNQVKVAIPCYMRFYNISGSAFGFSMATPMGITATIEMITNFSVVDDQVEAKLSEAVTTLTGITPAPGAEGSNYTTNKTAANFGGIDLDAVIADNFALIAQNELTNIGDVQEQVPSVETIEDFIAEEVRKELVSRKEILIWEPAPPEGSDVTINDVTIKALDQGLAMALNNLGSGNANALSFFVPNDRDFATAINGAKVIAAINEAITDEFGSLPTTLDDKVEGKTVKLNSLTPSLKSGAIDLEGEVTVVDAIAGSIDVDADFDADVGLRWINNPDGEGQMIEPFVIGEPDVDLSLLAWILSFLIGFITFGIVGVIIVAVVLSIADDLAESIGAAVIRDDISDQIKGIGAWPQSLSNIGNIDALFANPIDIDSQSVLFSGTMIITSMHALTSEDFANSNGPYFAVGNQALLFDGGAEKATSDTFWDFDDGHTDILRKPSHVYGKSGLYIAKLRVAVTEEGGVTTRHFTKVNIENVAPQVLMPENVTVNEGEEVPLIIRFIDVNWLDTHTATIDWGDNSAPEDLIVSQTNEPPQAQGEMMACHAYCDNGTYTVKVTVRDDVGGIGIGQMMITVENVAPEVYLPDVLYSLEKQCVRLEGFFTDQGWCDTHTGVWHLGDCTKRNAYIEEINEPPQAEGLAQVAHAFDRCGDHQVKLDITDDDGATGVDTMIVHVNRLKNDMLEDGFYVFSLGGDRNDLVIANHWYPYAAQIESFAPSNNQTSIDLDYAYEIGVVSEGQRSQKMILSGNLQAGIMQRIGVNKDWDYEFTAHFHSPDYHRMIARIGIDPLGGADPSASSVVWRELTPGLQWKNITVRTRARAEQITLFVGGIQPQGGRNSIYIDQTALYQIQPHCPIEEQCEESCINFADLNSDTTITQEFEYQGLLFTPPQEGLFMTQIGNPQGQSKLGFHNAGMRITFPIVVDQVEVTITNHAGRVIFLEALFEDEVLENFQEIINNETKTIRIEVEQFNGLIIHGGDSEAALVEICLCMPIEDPTTIVEDEDEVSARPGTAATASSFNVQKKQNGTSMNNLIPLDMSE